MPNPIDIEILFYHFFIRSSTQNTSPKRVFPKFRQKYQTRTPSSAQNQSFSQESRIISLCKATKNCSDFVIKRTPHKTSAIKLMKIVCLGDCRVLVVHKEAKTDDIRNFSPIFFREGRLSCISHRPHLCRCAEIPFSYNHCRPLRQQFFHGSHLQPTAHR